MAVKVKDLITGIIWWRKKTLNITFFSQCVWYLLFVHSFQGLIDHILGISKSWHICIKFLACFSVLTLIFAIVPVESTDFLFPAAVL